MTKRTFAPGHDAKLKSTLRKSAESGDDQALGELERRGWMSLSNSNFSVEVAFSTVDTTQLARELESRRVKVVLPGDRARVIRAWRVGSVTPKKGEPYLRIASPELQGQKGVAEMREVCVAIEEVGGSIISRLFQKVAVATVGAR